MPIIVAENEKALITSAPDYTVEAVIEEKESLQDRLYAWLDANTSVLPEDQIKALEKLIEEVE